MWKSYVLYERTGDRARSGEKPSQICSQGNETGQSFGLRQRADS